MSLQSPKLTHAGALTTESPLSDLAAIVRSHTPLIAVETKEELQAFDACDQPSQSVLKSQEMLSYIKNSGSHCLFVLLDFHRYLQDDIHVRFLKDIALASGKNYSTVMLVAT